MKRLILLAIFSIATITINAQEVSEEQWVMVSKKTATWCTKCGTWGWTFKDYLFEDYQDQNVLIWMAHYSGDLMTPTAQAITENLGGVGQPIFYINEDNMGVGSSNLNAKREEFQLFIETISGLPAFAGVGSTAVFDGEKITTTSKVKFLSELEGGRYWLASYLVDDIVVANQASIGNNAEHQNVLLHSFNGEEYFGVNVVNGAVQVNDEFTSEGELDFSGEPNIPDFSDGYSVVTVLWTEVDGQYKMFNLNKQPITVLSSTKDILSEIEVAAFHAGAGQVRLNIQSDVKIGNAKIHLIDMSGRTLAIKSSVHLTQGANELALETQDLSLGTYIVVVESEKGSRSIKVSVR